MSPTVWRDPGEESADLYPGLVVHDGRVTGSITAGRSRLPLWAFTATAIHKGWDEVEDGWSPSDYGWTKVHHSQFLGHLLDARGEFARLLLVLAAANRTEGERDLAYWDEHHSDGGILEVHPGTPLAENAPGPWWTMDDLRGSVVDQLRRCLAVLDADAFTK